MARPVQDPVTGTWPGSLFANVRKASSSLPLRLVLAVDEEELVDRMTFGIDVACRAARQVSLADERGRLA
jgi:hypothetical protein